jgi:glutamyl-tRNA synthetase
MAQGNTAGKVITRFPPSPTGFLHIGSVRTALFNYLFAARNGGEMVFRFEDTDIERSKVEFEKDIIDGMEWLGLPLNTADVVRQSERTEVYKKHLNSLIEKGLAYEAEESEATPGAKVIRFKNTNTKVTFSDLVRGEVTFDTTELGDFVIARSHELPLYHLAVVVDDADMHVTHVIRGEDHISNTQRQILLIEALGFSRPAYAHIPLILATDRSKMSKRHGAVSINEYRLLGFVPEAILNYLALLGWNPGGEQELFTLEELVSSFSLERVHKAGAVFDIEKLKWFNAEHLKKLSVLEYEMRLQQFLESHGEKSPDYLVDIIPELRNRAQTLGEAAEALRAGEFNFMDSYVEVDPLLLLQGAKADATAVKSNLTKVQELLAGMPETLTAEAAKEKIFPFATEVGRAGVLWPLRVALSGKEKSPDPFTLLSLLGKEKSAARIEAALQIL